MTLREVERGELCEENHVARQVHELYQTILFCVSDLCCKTSSTKLVTLPGLVF